MTSEEDISIENLDYPGCSVLPPSIAMLRRAFTLLIRGHWANGQFGYLQDFLKCGTYTGESGGMVIDPAFSDETWKNSTFPAIYIDVGNMDFAITAIPRANVDAEDNSGYTGIFGISCQLTIPHLAGSADQATIMAESTATFLLGAFEAYSQVLSIAKIQPQRISKAALRSEERPYVYRADFIATLAFEFNVGTSIESHRLKKVVLEVDPTTN